MPIDPAMPILATVFFRRMAVLGARWFFLFGYAAMFFLLVCDAVAMALSSISSDADHRGQMHLGQTVISTLRYPGLSISSAHLDISGFKLKIKS